MSEDREMWVRSPYTQEFLGKLDQAKRDIIARMINGEYLDEKSNCMAVANVQLLLSLEDEITNPDNYAEAQVDEE